MAQTSDQIRAGYDAVAAEYAERFAGELAHKPLDRELLGRFADEVRGRGLVYDLGCGPRCTTHLRNLFRIKRLRRVGRQTPCQPLTPWHSGVTARPSEMCGTTRVATPGSGPRNVTFNPCLLYTSDAADE